MPVLSIAEAKELVVATLTRCRTNVANARSVARALVAAEADGLKGHGLSRVPSYAAQAKVGKVDGFATPAVTYPRPAVLAAERISSPPAIATWSASACASSSSALTGCLL
jgi:(2R)-3-sulfolactate dehydrogenase (NADP+)